MKICQRTNFLKKISWFLSISRNVIIVLLSTLTAFLWTPNPPFQLTGPVVGGFPSVEPPSFRLPYNSTTVDDPTSYLSVWETLTSRLGGGPLILALIAVLQNVAISKSFGAGQSIDGTQEMLALGMSNVVGSFFSSLPICGSFSRSAVNDSSGVTSQLGGLFTGILTILSLSFLTSYFYFIPKASLAAVIISAVMGMMIEFKTLKIMWKINRWDLFSFLVTFISSVLFGMEYGIMIGVGVSLAILLLKSLKPGLNSELRIDPGTGISFIYAKPDYGLHFPSVDYIRTSLAKLCE